MLIRNNTLANTKVILSFGAVEFDAYGVAEVTPDEKAQLLLALPNYFEVDAEDESKDDKKEEEKEEPKEEVKEEPKEEEVEEQEPIVPEGIAEAVEEANEKAEKANEGMTHKQLDALASKLIEEGKLSEEDYPKSGDKKEKVSAINK